MCGHASAFSARAVHASQCAFWTQSDPPMQTAPSAVPSMRIRYMRCAKRRPSSSRLSAGSSCSIARFIESPAVWRRTRLYVTLSQANQGDFMKRLAGIFVSFAAAAALAAGGAFAQAKRDFDAEAQAAVQSAKTAAGFEFLGTLVRVCLLPQSGGEDASDVVPAYVANPASAPARNTWYAEPAKVFDNLYFVGGKIHSAWALTTREGIILIDTIYPYNSEELIVGGMKKLGLDPKNIKYVLVSHAHGDHIGGAEMLQTRYGVRVVMGGPDWDNVARFPNRYKTMAPKRDIVATDGMKITLGGETVTVWLTPGHTPGTISYTFSVLDRGKRVNVAYSGGTAFNFVNNMPDPGIKNFQTYIDSQKHMAAKAASTGATVLLSNHSEFDNAFNKNRMLAGRGDGPHPYELGADWVQRYFQVMQGCARAAQIRLEQKAIETTKR